MALEPAEVFNGDVMLDNVNQLMDALETMKGRTLVEMVAVLTTIIVALEGGPRGLELAVKEKLLPPMIKHLGGWIAAGAAAEILKEEPNDSK